MRTIYKYDISTPAYGIIEGPITRLLHVGVQNETIMVWAEVDTDAPKRKFQFIPVGTGWDLTEGNTSVFDTHAYLGTVMLSNGAFVFHIYCAEIITAPVKTPEPPKARTEKKVASIKKNQEATFSGTITMINPEVLQHFIS